MLISHLSNKLWLENLSVASPDYPIVCYGFFAYIWITGERNISYTFFFVLFRYVTILHS